MGVRVAPSGGSGWVAKLVDARRARAGASEHGAPAGEAGAPGGAAFGGRRAEHLQSLLVPEKVVAAHGESFAAAKKELAKLREVSTSLEPWRARQLDRLLEQLYKSIGLELGLTPAAERPAIAKEMIGAAARLAGRLRESEHLVPALFALTSLVDSGVRLRAQGRLQVTSAEAAGLVDRAGAVLVELATGLAGRAGIASAINVFPNLTEQLERSVPRLEVASGGQSRPAEGQVPAGLDAGERAALWRCAVDLLRSCVPARGFDLVAQAHLAEVTRQVLAEGAGPGDVAERVRGVLAAEAEPAAKGALAAAHRRKPKLPEVGQAIERVVAGNPLGPAALYDALVELRGHAEAAVNGGDAASAELWRSAAALLSRCSDRPCLLELVRRLNELIPKAIGRQEEADRARISATLARAAAAEGPGASHEIAAQLFELKLAIKKKTIAEYPGLGEALAGLRQLDGDAAILVSLAVSQRLNNVHAAAPMLAGAIELAKRGTGENPWAALDGFVERFTALAGALEGHTPEKELYAVVGQVAELTTGAKLEHAPAIAELLDLVQRVLPRARLLELLEVDPRGGSALLALVDPAVRYRHPPLRFLEELAPLLARPAKTAEAQLEAGRLAVALATRLGNLDGDVELPLARLAEDLAKAAKAPEALQLGGRPRGSLAVRNAQKVSLSAFLAANPELPLELAATAGLHLGREQLAWVSERIGAAEGRDRVRSLRDFVFACVEAGRLDAIDVVRRSPSPAKAISRAITEIGREYRAGHLDRIPWEELFAGLRAGGDPVTELARRRVEEGMSALVAPGVIGPASGKEMLEKCAPAIAACLAYYREKKDDRNADCGIAHGACIAPLEAAVKSVRDGTWPSVKYETPIGRRLLAALTPDQERIWREEMVTGAEGAKPIQKANEAPEVMKLLTGLAKALPMSVRLPEGMRWTAASSAKVDAERRALLDQLHEVEKGSARHKELGARLGALTRPAIVLGLKVAIDAGLAEKVSTKELLLRLKPGLEDAERALRRLDAVGAADAVAELFAAAEGIRDQRQPVRFGHYAVDEDSLEALLMSHTEASGSCLNYQSGFRKWALAGSAADANIRMLRTYNGDKFSYRAFLKVFPVETKGYKGPALWLDEPCAEGPAGNDDLELLYLNAIRKGQAMGIPVMAPSSDLTDAGEKLGLRTTDGSVKFTIDAGNTDCMHSDHMFGGAGNLRQLRGKKQHAIVESHAQIVFP